MLLDCVRNVSSQLGVREQLCNCSLGGGTRLCFRLQAGKEHVSSEEESDFSFLGPCPGWRHQSLYPMNHYS